MYFTRRILTAVRPHYPCGHLLDSGSSVFPPVGSGTHSLGRRVTVPSGKHMFQERQSVGAAPWRRDLSQQRECKSRHLVLVEVRALYADPPSTLTRVLSLLLKTLTPKPRKGVLRLVYRKKCGCALKFVPALRYSRHLGGRV